MAFGIGEAITAGLKVIDKFIPDPAAKAEAEKELRNGLLEYDKGQMEVNKAEAVHRSVFVAGWRPFVGWVCGGGFALHVLVLPVANYVLVATGGKVIDIAFDMNVLMTVLMGMLGMGGLRTYEKLKGLTK
jgi:hypothetical protein